MAFLPEKNYLEETIFSNYDLSLGTTAFTTSDLSRFKTFSIQFIYSGTNSNNLFKLEQSNDNTNWSDLSEEYEIPVGTGNWVIDKINFSGKYIRTNISIVSSGYLTAKLLAKR